MNPGAVVARAAWLRYWNFMRRWHRYEVRGIEHLDVAGPALVVGYHGRPIAHDLCMLQALMLERTGRLPRAIIHRYFRDAPILRSLYEGFEFLDGEKAGIDEAVARGDVIIVTPGGPREGFRGFRDRYRVDWEGRYGWVRLAVQKRLPIIPAAAWGVDDTYFAVNNGWALGKRVGLPGGMPIWLAFGPTGPWPLSPPWPVKITQLLGAPIDPLADAPPGGIDPRDREALGRIHRRVAGAVQAMLDSRPGRAAA